MLFEELGILYDYNSSRNDVYNDFFNRILPHSILYKRFGGLFSGRKFVQCAEGIQDFIKENDGKMELAIIPVFDDEKDKEALQQKTRDEVIAEHWMSDLSKIEDDLQRDHVKALAWMIAAGKLVIKLIIPEHEDGKPLTREELMDLDIFRNEVGIFYGKDDEQNKPLSFRGVIDVKNEESGEYVSITTSRPWIESEEKNIKLDFEKFKNFWNNETYQIGSITCKIEPLSDKLLEYFEQTAPKSVEEIGPLKKLPTLRTYQEIAVKKWQDKNCRGVFEMATGTGKTFTAIGCIKELETKHDKLLVIIAAPYTNLVDQWQGEISKWYIDSSILNKRWTQTIFDEVYTLNNNKDEKALTILICTHAKFARKELLKEIEKCKIPTMLIVDEAHHVGSGNTEKDDDGVISTEGARKGLSEKYQYRLALSATIDRHHDADGTDFLRKYFMGTTGESTYVYDLKKAIKNKKLCGYNYYPYFVELTEYEFEEYKKITYRAVRLLHSKNLADRIKGEDLMIFRGKIIRDAEQKMSVFIEIMKEFSDIKHLLVFCSEKQFRRRRTKEGTDIDGVEEILDNPQENFDYSKRIDYRKIIHDNPKKTKDRMKILKSFAEEDYHIILANKVLDEGMDVPQAKACIILASTGNPAQFIQRRGRVLRNYDDRYKDGSRKTHADIYDILVRPRLDGMVDPESRKLEIGMIRSQLGKIRLMSELAINYEEHCKKKIEEFTQGLPKDVLEKKWE